LTNCTVSLNQALGFGGGIAVPSNNLNVTLVNTIVAGNTEAGGGFGYTEQMFGADIDGAAYGSHDLIGNGSDWSSFSGSNGNIVGSGRNPINAMLGPLANNGGPTQAMALLAGSPAIGHADSSKAPATDERGLKRLDEAGETTDIGAFEL
jgi:hypothetical protein